MSDTSKANSTVPAKGAFVITPSNDEFEVAVRMITVGTAGVLVFEDIFGLENTTAELPPGNYPVAAIKVLPATTAANLTGWF